MKRVLILLILSILTYAASAQPKWSPTTINLDKRFHNAIEISSIVYLDGIIYLPSPICDLVYMGKIKGDSLEIFAEAKLANNEYEGASYYKGNFYFSDDRANSVFKYGSNFGQAPHKYHIKLDNYKRKHKYEGINRENNGFEGIVAINEAIFYILLERNFDSTVSVLYKLHLIADTLHVVDVKYIKLENKTRYSDLFYDRGSNTLYLLHTKRKYYAIETVTLDKNYDVKQSVKSDTIKPNFFENISTEVNLTDVDGYDTNAEGLAMVDINTILIVTDNCQACPCGYSSKKTLLMRLTRRSQ